MIRAKVMTVCKVSLVCLSLLFVFFYVNTFVTAETDGNTDIGTESRQGQISMAGGFGEQGETVRVTVSLDANPGVAAFLMNLEYDRTRLELSDQRSVTRGLTGLRGMTFVGPNADTYRSMPLRMVWFGASNNTSTGRLINVDFTILDYAQPGDAFVRAYIIDGEANDGALTPVIFPPVETTIRVTGVPKPTPIPTPEPTAEPGATPSPTAEPGATPTATAEPGATPTATAEPGATPTITAEPGATPATTPYNPQPTPISTPGIEVPKEVDITELPPEVQEKVDDIIFTVDRGGGASRERVLMALPFNRRGNANPESLVALQVSPEDSELVILSLYDEATSEVRLLGYTGELYTVSSLMNMNFIDVPDNAWFTNAVSFVAARGLFTGVGNSLFAPQTTMTRAMFITVLSGLEDFDNASYTVSPFTDVPIGSWYGVPVAWAFSQGIIDERLLNDEVGTFRPNDDITREEMALIFANYLANRGFPLATKEVPVFDDLNEANPWSRVAIQEMRQHAIISGVGDNLYNPQRNATRAEVAQIYTNLVRAIVGLS